MNNWPRSSLSDEDVAIIEKVKWVVYPFATVIAITEGWNAGLTTAQTPADLQVKPGSLRVLIGRLTQLGVELRRAAPYGDFPAVKFELAVRPTEPVASVSPGHLARMRRLAEFDPVIRRCLGDAEQGRRFAG